MTTCIAIDAMGGDGAPKIVFDGIAEFIRTHPHTNVQFLAFGQEDALTSLLTPALRKHVTIKHAPEVITGQLKPSLAVRIGRKSSMGMAIDAVSQGVAHAVVSGQQQPG